MRARASWPRWGSGRRSARSWWCAAAGVAALAAVPGAAQATPWLTPGPTLQATGGAFGSVVADVNGDHVEDLVADSITNAGELVVFLGTGTGGFGAGTAYLASSGSQFPVAADFDGDGAVDLAVAGVTGDVSVLLGHGDGTFAPAVHYAAPRSYALTVADVDGDGVPDLIADVYSTSRLQILLGDGDGTFTLPADMAAPAQPVRTAVGDLDGDGDADLVTAGLNDHALDVRLGHGDGTFTPGPVPAPFAVSPMYVAMADVDHDGDQDVVAVDNSGTISVLLGHGDGTLTAGQTIATGLSPQDVAFGDLDGDGAPDLAFTNWAVDGQLVTYLGQPDGTFSPGPAIPAAGPLPFSASIGDLDGDGHDDLAVTNGDPDGTITTFLGHDDPAAPVTTDDVPAFSSAPVAVTLAADDGSDPGAAGVAHTYYTVGANPPAPTTADAEYDPTQRPVLDDGERISYFSTDNAGNVESVRTSGALHIDTAAPTTTDDVPRSPQAEPVAITLTAGDGPGGSGVAHTYYTVGADPLAPTAADAEYDPAHKPVLHGGERISYFSTDHVGNAERVRVSRAVEAPPAVDAPPAVVAPPPPAGVTAITATIAGRRDGAGRQPLVLLDGTAPVGCEADAGTIATCRVMIASMVPLLDAGGHRVAVGTILATGSAPAGAASAATLSSALVLTAAGRSTLARHPLGITARATLTSADAGGHPLSAALTVRIMRSGTLALRLPARAAKLPARILALLDRLVQTMPGATDVRCTATTDPQGSAAADRARTRTLARAACARLLHDGLRATTSSAGTGHDHLRASNRTAEGRGANRRLRIQITV
ncbi:MAG TPA: FG-GAP-like repeat-containing protein [Baekduia sp.]